MGEIGVGIRSWALAGATLIVLFRFFLFFLLDNDKHERIFITYMNTTFRLHLIIDWGFSYVFFFLSLFLSLWFGLSLGIRRFFIMGGNGRR
jgi:hypothetical protein